MSIWNVFNTLSHLLSCGNGGNGADTFRNPSLRGPYVFLPHNCRYWSPKGGWPVGHQEEFWNRDTFHSKIALTRSVPRASVQVLKKNSCTLQNFLRSFGPSWSRHVLCTPKRKVMLLPPINESDFRFCPPLSWAQEWSILCLITRITLPHHAFPIQRMRGMRTASLLGWLGTVWISLFVHFL